MVLDAQRRAALSGDQGRRIGVPQIAASPDGELLAVSPRNGSATL